MPQLPITYRKLITGLLPAALVWAGFHAWIIHRFGFDWSTALVDSAGSNTLLIGACCALGNLLKNYRPGKRKALTLISWSFVIAGIYLAGDFKLLYFLFYENGAYIEFLHQSLPLRYATGLLVIGCFTVLAWVWNYLASLQEDENRKKDTEKMAKDAELANLRQQLQPHFLFNSLNSISALISIRPAEAKKMTQQLSDFLRGTLRKDEQKLVPLEEELNHLQLYLDIEKVRFGHRLNTEINADEASLKLMLPSLLLQPVVENAIKFGLYDTTDTITISIKSAAKNDMLVITIENPFDPETRAPKGTGFGLDSIKRRLYLLFARNDLLQTQVNGKLFITIVMVPQN